MLHGRHETKPSRRSRCIRGVCSVPDVGSARVAWWRAQVIINFSLYPIKSTRQMSPCEAGYLYVPVAFLCTLYLVYLVECWLCTTRHGSSPKVAAAELEHRARQMRNASPVVWWKAVCYHYVRRKRQVTRRNRHGDAYTCTQAFYERVNTHAAGGAFAYQRCGVKDESPELVLDPRTPITHVRFTKGFAFVNVEAADEFEEQRSRFFSEHESQDDYMEMREGLALTGVSNFRERLVAFTDPDRPPWFARPLVFWLASCLLLSWPLRLIQEANTAHLHYKVTKVFGVNYEEEAGRGGATAAWAETEGQEGARGRCVSRESTATSCDTALWDQAIAPSYSEALLMEATRPTAAALVCTDAQASEPAQVTLADETSQLLLDGAEQNRRSRGVRGLVLSLSTHSVQTAAAAIARSVERIRIPTARSSPSVRVMYLSAPLEERLPRDPFQGRAVTTPTEEEEEDDENAIPAPPSYDDALRFPALTRLKRSLTDRDVCRCACVESVLVTERVQVHASNRPRSVGINMETSL